MAGRKGVEVGEARTGTTAGPLLSPLRRHQTLQDTREAKEARMEKEERMGKEARARARLEPGPAYVLPKQDTDRLRGLSACPRHRGTMAVLNPGWTRLLFLGRSASAPRSV